MRTYPIHVIEPQSNNRTAMIITVASETVKLHEILYEKVRCENADTKAKTKQKEKRKETPDQFGV